MTDNLHDIRVFVENAKAKETKHEELWAFDMILSLLDISKKKSSFEKRLMQFHSQMCRLGRTYVVISIIDPVLVYMNR